jgi:hypothetical protein
MRYCSNNCGSRVRGASDKCYGCSRSRYKCKADGCVNTRFKAANYCSDHRHLNTPLCTHEGCTNRTRRGTCNKHTEAKRVIRLARAEDFRKMLMECKHKVDVINNMTTADRFNQSQHLIEELGYMVCCTKCSNRYPCSCGQSPIYVAVKHPV